MCSLNITVYGLLERYFQKLNCHLIFQIGRSVILNWETSNHLNNNCLTVSIKTSQYGNKKRKDANVFYMPNCKTNKVRTQEKIFA